MLKYTWWCLMGILFATAAQAQTAREGVQSFQQESDAWRRQAAQKAVPLPRIVSEVGQMAIDNIVNAEQAFVIRFPIRGRVITVIRWTAWR